MHFSSISSCDLGATVAVSATNDTAASKYLYLPALNNFVSVVINGVNWPLTSESRITLPMGHTVVISLTAPATNLATVFYEYAASNVTDGEDKYAGYFSVTGKSQRNVLSVLASERSKKWYNYTPKTHKFVYYEQGTAYTVTPSIGKTNLITPLHVVLDPTTEKTYIYSSQNGQLLSSIPAPSAGARPFAYKKVVINPDSFFTDLSTSQQSVAGNVVKSATAPQAGRYSAEFNGVTNYLTTNSAVLNLSNQDFSIEFWIRPAAIPAYDMSDWAGNRDLVYVLLSDGVDTAIGFGLTKLFLVVNSAIIITATHNFVKNTWTHVVFSRKSNSITIFVNGAVANAGYYAGSINNNGTLTYVGIRGRTGNYFKGNLTNLQVVSGQTAYTPSSYTVPTLAFPLNSATLFSLGLPNGTYSNGQLVSSVLVDSTNRNTVTTVNDVTVDTGIKKFSSQSLYFNDAGIKIVDSLVPTTKTMIDSDDIVIEWWAYPVASTFDQVGLHYGLVTNFNNFSFLSSTQDYIVYADSTNNVFLNTYARTNATFDTWNHYAIVRKSKTYKFYRNGSLEFVGNYSALNSVPTDTLYFGADGGANKSFKGYIDGFVIKNTSNEIINTFVPSTTLNVHNNSILALDFSSSTAQSLENATRIENYVFVLTTDGIVTKVKVDNTTVASPKLPGSVIVKKPNWFFTSGQAHSEDLPYIGTFIDGSQIRQSQISTPGISSVDYYGGTVYVAGSLGIQLLNGDTLDSLGNISTGFVVSSIKVISSGFLVTSMDHKIYYLTAQGDSYLIYTATVLGIPDALGNEWFVPDCENHKLVVINLTTNFVANYNNSVSNVSRYVNLDATFAPSFVVADTGSNLIFICGHDSDIVYYCNGSAPLSSIVFDNKVAWVSANTSTLMVSYFLVEYTILDVSLLQRSARIYLDTRIGPTYSNLGTPPFRVKMLGRHNNVQITAPGFSNSTTVRLPNGTVFSNGNPVKPAWIQNFENGSINSWANGVPEYTDVVHNDYVSISYKSFDTQAINLNFPYIVGDRHTLFAPAIDVNTASPKNFLDDKHYDPQAYSIDPGTVVLLHMTGTNGSKNFQNSASGLTYTGTGSASVFTGYYKFDGSSALFAGGYITVPATARLGFGTGDFTVEFWLKTSTTGASAKLLIPNGDSLGQWAIYLDSTGLLVWANGTNKTTVPNNYLNDNIWRHVAISRLSSNITIYIDGTPQTTFYDNTDYSLSGVVDYYIGGGTVSYGSYNVPVYQTANNGIWSDVDGITSTFIRNVTLNFPVTGKYVFSCEFVEYGTLSLDGTLVLTVPQTTKTNLSGDITISVTAGTHVVNINATTTLSPGSAKILIVSTTGRVVYQVGTGLAVLGSYSGSMDELRISDVARYTGQTFLPNVPTLNANSIIKAPDLFNVAVFEFALSRLFVPTLAALEYGTMTVNSILYTGNTTINSYDTIRISVPVSATQTTFAPILRIGAKEFALPINNVIQTLSEIAVEIANVNPNTRVDYTGHLTVTVAGVYYIPNYSTAFVTAIKKNNVTMAFGNYVTMAVGDTIDIYGILSSPRISDTVDVFVIGPVNYQITVETIATYLPKFMDFGLLKTTNQSSADLLVQAGHSSVGLITDPFVRFNYQSSPMLVQGIPANENTGLPQPITLSTDQAIYGATIIRTTAGGTVTQSEIMLDVVNGDTIQIVKKLYDYRETGIILQVLYLDTNSSVSDVYDIGKWTVIQTAKSSEFLSPSGNTGLEPNTTARSDVDTYYDLNFSFDRPIVDQIQFTTLDYSLINDKFDAVLPLTYVQMDDASNIFDTPINYKNAGSDISHKTRINYTIENSIEPSKIDLDYQTLHQEPLLYELVYQTLHDNPIFYSLEYQTFHDNPIFYNLEYQTFHDEPFFYNLEYQTFHDEPLFYELEYQTQHQAVYEFDIEYQTQHQETYEFDIEYQTQHQATYSFDIEYQTQHQEAYEFDIEYQTQHQATYSFDIEYQTQHQAAYVYNIDYQTHHQAAYEFDIEYQTHHQGAYGFDIEYQTHHQGAYGFDIAYQTQHQGAYSFDIEYQTHHQGAYGFDIAYQMQHQGAYSFDIEYQTHHQGAYEFDIAYQTHHQGAYEFDIAYQTHHQGAYSFDIEYQTHHQGAYGFDIEYQTHHQGAYEFDIDYQTHHQGAYSFDIEYQTHHQGAYGFDIDYQNYHQSAYSFDIEYQTHHQAAYSFDIDYQNYHQAAYSFDIDYQTFHQGAYEFDIDYQTFHQGAYEFDIDYQIFHQGAYLYDIDYQTFHDNFNLAKIGYQIQHQGAYLYDIDYKTFHDNFNLAKIGYQIQHAGYYLYDIDYKTFHDNFNLAKIGYQIQHSGYYLGRTHYQTYHGNYYLDDIGYRPDHTVNYYLGPTHYQNYHGNYYLDDIGYRPDHTVNYYLGKIGYHNYHESNYFDKIFYQMIPQNLISPVPMHYQIGGGDSEFVMKLPLVRTHTDTIEFDMEYRRSFADRSFNIPTSILRSVTDYHFKELNIGVDKSDIILINMDYLLSDRFNLVLQPLDYKKYDRVNIIYRELTVEFDDELEWEANSNLPSVGGFDTEAAARADAAAKNYLDYTIRYILNKKGVVYFSYRVNFDNEIICNLTTAKSPFYGLIQGG